MSKSTPPSTSTSRSRLITAERVFIGLVAVAVAVTFALIVVTLNRGFDWSDEAFVYTMISSNRSGPGEFWGFQHLLHPIYELFGSSVLAFRILRLVGYVALGFILTFVAKRVLDSTSVRLRRSSWVVIALLAQVGTFAAWSYPPRYLGYNELSSWLAQLGGALFIFLLVSAKASQESKKTLLRVLLLWAVVGALVAMLLFAKITAAVLFLVLAVVVALVPASQGNPLKRLGALLVGVVATLTLMLATGVPVLEYIRHIVELLLNPSAQEASGYSLTSLLVTYLYSATLTAGALAVPILLATYVLFASGGFFGRSRTSMDSPPLSRSTFAFENTSLVFAGLLVLIVLLPSTTPTWDHVGIANTFMFFLAILAFAMIFPARSTAEPGQTPRTLTVTVGVLIFAVTPFVNAVGTNNAIFGQTLFSATLWAVGAGVTLCILWERTTAHSRTVRFLPVLLIGAIVAGAGFSVVADVFVHPYRTTPYLSQTVPVNVGQLRGLQLAEGEPEMVEWLHDAGLRENAAGVPAIGIGFSGRLFVFNASGWASPWPGPDWQSSIERACDAERPEELFVIQPQDEKSGSARYEELAAGLLHCGIAFPDDFIVVDKYDDGADGMWNTTIWKLK